MVENEFQAMVTALERNLLDRIDRSDVFVTNNINSLKAGLDDMRREVNGMDKQIAVMSERQSRIGEIEKVLGDFTKNTNLTLKDLDARVAYNEAERRKVVGIANLLKWIIGILTGGGVISVLVSSLHLH